MTEIEETINSPPTESRRIVEQETSLSLLDHFDSEAYLFFVMRVVPSNYQFGQSFARIQKL